MKPNEQAPGRWHKHAVRVRYQETDRMGVVYHANYVNWFELGRTELIRDRGFPYSRIEEMGLFLPVVELESKFHLPAKYDDEIAIFTRISSFNGLTVKFESQIRRQPGSGTVSGYAAAGLIEPEGELLVAGMTRHVWLNRDWKPVRLDREAPELFRLLGDER
ncbi:acyl-CoA thioesterase [Paenibacillus ginsengarvi]|uniref:Acyl-CoA thioesterase n=1 Tax=Paenibacillus ginsengarvi TaxID=400777 RepID=A0A3B0CML0_9BACL|nr:thioesterase family protein [Paenibacillus ginsengarvi]RKN85499.1 acyl-CoA thioesterase [Paenibacillus ginsengarvi]